VRVAIATVQVPFVQGGAEAQADGLRRALVRAGHRAELVTMPFRFAPEDAVRRGMRIWSEEDFERFSAVSPDRVICLKFPTWYLSHREKVVWLMHQHRAAYDLYGTPHDGGLSATREGERLRDEIVERDRKALSGARALFTESHRVSERLKRYNGLQGEPLYHPPALEDRLYCAEPEPYIFYPSRLEDLKRQRLLIEAMAYVRSPVVALLAGEGGAHASLQRRIDELGLSRRVKLMGFVTEEELLAGYAHALGVFYGPLDEDYGYGALESALASKPLITCSDSGGPLEFLRAGETAHVVEPTPETVAAAIDALHADRARAIEMGRAARSHYQAMAISWDHVVETLLGA